MLTATEMIMFCSLSLFKQQLVERAIHTGEVIIDPQYPQVPSDLLVMVESILEVFAKNSPIDSIRCLAKLSEDVSNFLRKRNESALSYIERFVLPAQAYLNLIDSDEASAESQDSAMLLLSNARLSQQTFSSVMASLVSLSKILACKRQNVVILTSEHVKGLMDLFQSILFSPTGNTYNQLQMSVNEQVTLLTSSKRRSNMRCKISNTIPFVSLSSTVGALEKTTIERKDVDPAPFLFQKR